VSILNIFYLDNDVKLCAHYHVDKHTIKQILEYAQILSTTHRIVDGEKYIDKTANNRSIQRWKLNGAREELLYKSTHWNHPSVKWCRESQQNYYWLYQLFIQLLAEYQYRYGKVHACTKLIPYLGIAPKNIPWKPFTEPTPAMDAQYIVPNDSLASYRNYYKFGKQHLHSWSNRPVPSWILE